MPTTVAYVTEGASVMVTNASRVDGAAGRMSDRLAAVGFTMVEPGNYSLGQIDVIVQRAAERQALEAENRQLARKVDGRDAVEASSDIAHRLDQIDTRLARIERALSDLTSTRR